jgi:hypothetical protein
MMRTTLRILAVLLPLAVLCGGCLAVGQAFTLATVALTLAASGASSIAIAVLDKREWIRSGAKKPCFAGTLRGGFGNPFDVNVRGYVPLAQVTADVVVKGLLAKGFKASAAKIDPVADDPAALAALKSSGAAKLLLIDIQKWQSDTYMKVGMHYLLVAKVMDAAGNVLAEASVTGADDGKDDLKGSAMNPAGYAKKVVPKAFRDQLERLLNADAIVKALA